MARVLLVEDDWMHREFLVRVLQIKGYEVAVAVNGEQAINSARQERPDAIIMDLGLPGIDGVEAIRRIRSQASTRSIPIVALTAYAMSEDQERASDAGCDAFESKPVDLDELEHKLRALIHR